MGIEFEVADRLVAFGLVSPEAFEGVTAEDLVGLGFEDPVAQDILAKVSVGSEEAEADSPVSEEGDAPAEDADEASPEEETAPEEAETAPEEEDSSSKEEEG